MPMSTALTNRTSGIGSGHALNKKDRSYVLIFAPGITEGVKS